MSNEIEEKHASATWKPVAGGSTQELRESVKIIISEVKREKRDIFIDTGIMPARIEEEPK